MKNLIEEKLVKLSNKKRNILEKLYYRSMEFLYLSSLGTKKREAMWENSFLSSKLLKEFKDILSKYEHTDHGILNTEALFLYCFLRKEKPDFVIESGTYRGYSSIFIGEALRKNNKGSFITISLNRDNCLDIARKRLADFPFVEVIKGESQDVLKKRFSLINKALNTTVFIDGPKGSMKEFDELMLLLNDKRAEGHKINNILIHDCEEHIPMVQGKGINSFLNLTRLKAGYYYRKYFSKECSLNFTSNIFYERYSFLDESIFKKKDTDIVPYNFKKGRQVSYGTSIALIRKMS